MPMMPCRLLNCDRCNEGFAPASAGRAMGCARAKGGRKSCSNINRTLNSHAPSSCPSYRSQSLHHHYHRYNALTLSHAETHTRTHALPHTPSLCMGYCAVCPILPNHTDLSDSSFMGCCAVCSSDGEIGYCGDNNYRVGEPDESGYALHRAPGKCSTNLSNILNQACNCFQVFDCLAGSCRQESPSTASCFAIED